MVNFHVLKAKLTQIGTYFQFMMVRSMSGVGFSVLHVQFELLAGEGSKELSQGKQNFAVLDVIFMSRW